MFQSVWLGQFREPPQQGEGCRCFLQDGWAELATGSHRTSQLGKRGWAFWHCWSTQAAFQVHETTASKHRNSNPLKVQPLSFGFRQPVPSHAKCESAKGWAEMSWRQSACQVNTRPLPGANRQNQSKFYSFFCQLKLLVNASWYFMAEIKQSCSTPELPFPGPWPVNTSSLAAAWPAVEQALNESCWSCSVKNPKLEPEGTTWDTACLPHLLLVWFLQIPWRVCSGKFSLQVPVLQLIIWPTFLMSGKPLQENNSLLRRRAPEIFFFLIPVQRLFF